MSRNSLVSSEAHRLCDTARNWWKVGIDIREEAEFNCSSTGSSKLYRPALRLQPPPLAIELTSPKHEQHSSEYSTQEASLSTAPGLEHRHSYHSLTSVATTIHREPFIRSAPQMISNLTLLPSSSRHALSSMLQAGAFWSPPSLPS